MKNKLIVTLFLLLLPFFAHAEDNQKTPDDIAQNEDSIKESNQNQEIPEGQQESPTNEVALNSPIDEIKNDLNINELSPLEAPTNINNTFPLNTTLGYQLDNNDTDYFFQAEGTDILNESKNRKINFLIKVPYFQINDATNKLGVVPDKFCLNFTDPLLSINLGDNKYNISTLTVKDLEKRGILLNLNYKDKMGFSTLYLLSKPSKAKNPCDNFAASFFINPLSFIKLSSNFLYTKFEKTQNSIPIDNYTYSVRSIIFLDNTNKFDLETAVTNNFNKKNMAYFANLEGKNKLITYLISGLYANPLFIGSQTDKWETTYSDKVKFDGSIKFNLNKFSSQLSHIFENNNLEKLSSKDKPKRSFSSEFSISHPIIFIESTLGVKRKESKNLLNKDGFKLDAANLNYCIPIKNFSFENNFEVGKYKSRIENYFSRNWFAYKIFMKYKLSDASYFSVYSKLGNLKYDDIFTISYVGGTDLKIKTIKNFDLSFNYEYSKNIRKCLFAATNKKPKWHGHYFKQELTYILPNQHTITITSHLNKPLDEKKEKAFLLTYTIPIQVPKINRAINGIRNTLF